MTEHGRQNKILLLISAGLVAATLIAYEPVRNNRFVSFDDELYITRNPNVLGGITQQSVIRAFTKYHFYMWHPLTTISHILDCQLFGLNPVGHHFVSVLFHILNALLLFWILVKMTGAIWPSAFVAGVFALHPLQVESVAWAAERKTVLSGMFWFLTIAVYVWYTKKPGILRYIPVFIIYSLCIMTKPVVVTLPIVLILLDYWPLNRTYNSEFRIKNLELRILRHRQSEDFSTLNSQFSILNSIYEKIPLFALSAILSVITVIAQREGEAISSLKTIPLDSRIANMFASYMKYIYKMIWPDNLTVYYSFPHINLADVKTIGYLTLFILISFLSVYIGRQKRYAAVGWLWFVGTLIPMIGLVQSGGQAMADRYMYLSMIGLLIVVAWGVKDLVINRLKLRIVAGILGAAVLVSATIVTRTQVRYWRDDLALFGHTIKFCENSVIVETGYGRAMSEANRLSEAEQHYRNAVRIDPRYFIARHNLGFILVREGKADEATACFKKLLQEGHNVPTVNLGLAMALSMQNKYDDAVRYFKESLRQDPGNLDARQKLGNVLMAMGKTGEAVLCLKESLQISPNQPQIYMMLGAIYEQTGDYKSAIPNWARAVELSPNNANALNSLAWLLVTSGEVSAENANKAVKLAERACEQTGYKNAMILDTLAAAYASAGRFEEAVTMANKAVYAANTSGYKDLADEIQERIKLYKAHQRYRQTQKTNER
ncbi:MAG: tetratricopeptide repeat protein [Sedimentisphaerales bacterium]